MPRTAGRKQPSTAAPREVAPRSGRMPSGPGLALLVRFVAIFLLLQALYHAIPDDVLATIVVHHALAQPAAWLIDTLGIADVRAATNQVLGARGTLEIIRGCDGSSSFFLLLAAIGAFPAAWRHQAAGIALGLLLLHAINVTRITGLYAALQADLQLFHLAHEFVAPTITVLATCLYYAWWCAQVRARSGRVEEAPRA